MSSPPVRIRLDRERCSGQNRCCLLAPDLFGADELGYAVLREEGELPPEAVSRARLAAENCPEFAIEIVEASDG